MNVSALVAVQFDDFLKLELPPREILLSPWLKASSINMIAASRGTGKTWCSLSIALAVASGGTFLKFTAPTSRRVLFIDGEMAATELQERFTQLTPMFPAFKPENLVIANPELQYMSMPDISTEHGQSMLEPWTKIADLIIVDNLSSLARTGVENDAESWNPVAAWALRMRREGRAVLFIHHAGKNGQQRGTSKREDLLDISVMLERVEQDASGAVFLWAWSKVRGIAGNDAEPLRAELVNDEQGGLVWTFRLDEDVRLEEIRQMVSDGATVDAIAEEYRISRAKAGRLRKAAMEMPSRQDKLMGQQ